MRCVWGDRLERGDRQISSCCDRGRGREFVAPGRAFGAVLASFGRAWAAQSLHGMWLIPAWPSSVSQVREATGEDCWRLRVWTFKHRRLVDSEL